MRLQVKILAAVGICALFFAPPATSLDAKLKSGLENFSHNIFHELMQARGQENIIFSPLSTHASLTMSRFGADGQTAVDMDHALGFTGQPLATVADNYYSLLSQYENSNNVHMANAIYVMENRELTNNYKRILYEKFFSGSGSVNFAQSEKAADTINNWVESKTNHMIKNLITPQMLDGNTRMVLVNAIHFKGEWAQPFVEEQTALKPFHTEDGKTIEVETMARVGIFQTAFYEDLQLYTLRLPYKDSDLSMLIVLPYPERTLAQTLDKLKNVDLTELTKKMKYRTVNVTLPKFKTEFTIELTDVLSKVGMGNMFDREDFVKLLKSAERLSLSKIVHKAFIDVNEKGTEAAASTSVYGLHRNRPSRFFVNRSFYYAIVNADNVALFQGTIVKP